MTNEIQYQFSGFSPDGDIKELVTSVVENLHFSAPSDAVTRVVINKEKDSFRVSCRIVSKEGIFLADTNGETLLASLKMTEKKIDHQIKIWKSRRFEESDDLEATF
jgi:ribosome-associated translation inhibitor RaiA